ncbi:MAG: hypothetical protein KAJ92_03920 [Gammaproteobacteria bacterium]|nr:hypothetical protein [Gammaproteobacteria bacterium]
MAIEITYDKQLQIIVARVHGYLCIEDIQNFMSEVLSSEDIPSDANTLWDITEMAFDNIDIQLQQKIVAMRKKFDSHRGNAKIAIVSNYSLGDIIVKLFLELAKDISQDVNAFKTREQAMLWFEQD